MSAPSQGDLSRAFAGKRVLVTGHTGFKGSWLVLWLQRLGAEVYGLSLAPESPRWLFLAAGVDALCHTLLGDVRDRALVRSAVQQVKPAYIFHLAAQPLVRASYRLPLETLETNLLGTAHLLDAVRLEGLRCVLVVVTTDKVYENREWVHGYREEDALGGSDLYAMSKAGAELLTAAYRASFFPPSRLSEHGVAVATARAGNVVGGGDWALDRLVPDAMAAFAEGRPLVVRNPGAVRPWQHVLEPLSGYLRLAARLAGQGEEPAASFCEPWNFGPDGSGARSVRELVSALADAWGGARWSEEPQAGAPPEAGILRLATDKARVRLGWQTRWSLEETVSRTVEVYRAQARGAPPGELRALCLGQLDAYTAGSSAALPSAQQSVPSTK